QMDNAEMIGSALTTLALIALQEQEFAEATRRAEEALSNFQQTGHDAHIAYSMLILGKIAARQKRYEEARRLLEESIGILKRVGNRLYLAQCERELAEVASAWKNNKDENA
ncbi:MAG: tetratricopeptide repeat protein, partial [Anaerolineales bacterium]|nr:tetratricopeptide repeat protein [Anaerolineales bacterium]